MLQKVCTGKFKSHKINKKFNILKNISSRLIRFLQKCIVKHEFFMQEHILIYQKQAEILFYCFLDVFLLFNFTSKFTMQLGMQMHIVRFVSIENCRQSWHVTVHRIWEFCSCLQNLHFLNLISWLFEVTDVKRLSMFLPSPTECICHNITVITTEILFDEVKIHIVLLRV